MLQVQALQMHHGLVPMPTSSSGLYPQSMVTSSVESDWTQDMEWEEDDGDDDDQDDEDANGGPSFYEPHYGPRIPQRVNRYGPC